MADGEPPAGAARGGSDQTAKPDERQVASTRPAPGALSEDLTCSLDTGQANVTATPRDSIGRRYRLLGQIGEGGMGIVYLADQHHPVSRRVAIKIIKPGVGGPTAVARFEAERQALALMDHPNIAKVLDGGTTDAGQPYFVMELVKGKPITQYCDDCRVGTAERLELFAQVCRAVQHAHQKAVIHRDLKPSNVLVTVHEDGRAVPKVIDFGVAKAINHRLTERTLFTEFNQFVGTPEYMSPEQADAGAADIDTRSDVYSLGVLLYELMTGTTPFDPRELRSKAYGEIQRIIREVEPPRPSTRIGSLAADVLGAVAARRRTEPGRLGRAVHGELDWIVMRCLEKDRTRRYDSAGALEADVRRFLAGETVTAGPPGGWYRLRKTLHRHRGVLSAVGSVTVALAIGFAVSTHLFLRESDARRQAVAAELEQGRLRVLADAARAGEAAEKVAARAAERRAERRAQEAELNAYEASASAVDAAVRLGDIPAARRRLDAMPAAHRGWEWAWLDAQADSSVVTLRLPNPTVGLTYDPARQRLIAVGWMSLLEYDAATWQPADRFEAMRTDFGRELTSSSPDAIAIDATGRRLAFGGFDGKVRLLDRHPSPHLVVLEDAHVAMATPTFSHDGKLLAVAYPTGGFGEGREAERVVPVWETATGKLLHSFRPAADKVMAAAFSPDGTRLATGASQFRPNVRSRPTPALSVWDLKGGNLLFSCLDEYGQFLVGLVFSHDGKTIYALRTFGLSIVDTDQGRDRSSIPLGDGRLTCLALSEKGDTLAVGCDNGHVLLLDASSGSRRRTLYGHVGSILALAFGPRDATLAAAAVAPAGERTIKVWDVERDARRYALYERGAPKLAAWSTDDSPLLYVYDPNVGFADGASGSMRIWDLMPRTSRDLPHSNSRISTFALGARGNRLAIGREDGVVELRQAPGGELIRQLKASDSSVSVLEFSPDASTLAGGCRDGTTWVWHLDHDQPPVRPVGDGREVGRLAFADGAKLLIVATTGIRWEENVPHQETPAVTAIRVADGARVWQQIFAGPLGPKDVPDFMQSRTAWPIIGLAVDGDRALTQITDGRFIALRLDTGGMVTLRDGFGLADSGEGRRLALSPDGRRLASVDRRTGQVKILRTEDCAELLTIIPAGRAPSCVTWSPDGRRLALVGVGQYGQDVEILEVRALPR